MAPIDSDDSLRNLKASISLIALGLLLVRVVFPDLKIDGVSIGLLALAILPWLSPLIKSAKLPGGFEIEFQDVKAAAERVTSGGETQLIATPPSEPSYLMIADQDPHLALTGLRIEIERRLRTLSVRANAPGSRSLSQLTKELQDRDILSAEAAAGLRDLIALGNQAAHGVSVAPEVAHSAVEYGPQVLRVLDSKIAQFGIP